MDGRRRLTIGSPAVFDRWWRPYRTVGWSSLKQSVSGLLVSPDELWTDLATPQLYEFLPGLGIAAVVNRLSRFVADPNRELRPPLHGDFWRAAVPSTNTRGKAIYERPLSDKDVARRIALAHGPTTGAWTVFSTRGQTG